MGSHNGRPPPAQRGAPNRSTVMYALCCAPIGFRRDVVETASMLAIRGSQALVKGPQVRRTLAWLERMPVSRFSIFDDRTGDRRVVFIESDPSSHVEKVSDRGCLLSCFTHLRDRACRACQGAREGHQKRQADWSGEDQRNERSRNPCSASKR
jgi:hypothetical protein